MHLEIPALFEISRSGSYLGQRQNQSSDSIGVEHLGTVDTNLIRHCLRSRLRINLIVSFSSTDVMEMVQDCSAVLASSFVTFVAFSSSCKREKDSYSSYQHFILQKLVPTETRSQRKGSLKQAPTLTAQVDLIHPLPSLLVSNSPLAGLGRRHK